LEEDSWPSRLRRSRDLFAAWLWAYSPSPSASSLFVAFFSVTYIAGVGFLGGFYGFILIALGVGLILPKKEQKNKERPDNI